MTKIAKLPFGNGLASLAFIAALSFGPPAWSQTPLALVEEVRGNPGVEFMDYVRPGTTIRLGPRDTVVLSYLSSCWRETISGGTVIVGTEQSEVEGGKFTRVKAPCNAGRIDLTPRQANQSAGTTLRAPDEAQLVYGLSPFFEATGRAALLVVSLDKPTEHFTAVLTRKSGSQVSYYDFASANMVLRAGRTYRASIGARQIVFKVDANAKPGRLPIISRLVRFPPAS